jgi:hypothetical protein
VGNNLNSRFTFSMTAMEKPCYLCKKEPRLPASSYCRGCYNGRKTKAAREKRAAEREKT